MSKAVAFSRCLRALRRCVVRDSGRPTRLVSWIFGGIAAYLLLLGLILPPALRPYVEKRLAAQLAAPCAIKSLSCNPFTLAFTMHGITIPYPQDRGVFLELRSLEFSPSLRSLLRLAPGLATLRFDTPVFDVTRYADGTISPQLFLPPGREQATGPGQSGPLFPFILQNFAVRNGSITFRDAIHNATQSITDININVPFTSTLQADRETNVTPRLDATVNGRQFTLQGESLPFSQTLRTEFTVFAGDIQLDNFRNYIRPYTPLIINSGAVSARLTLGLERHEQQGLLISMGGQLRLDSLELLSPAGKQALHVPRAGIDVTSAFLLGPVNAHVTDIFMDSPSISIARLADGAIDWERYVIPQQRAPNAKPAAAPSEGDSAPQRQKVRIDKVRIANGTVRWTDAAIPGGLARSVTNIALTLDGIDTADRGTAAFALSFGEDPESFSLAGNCEFFPPKVTATINARRLDLAPFSPYAVHAAGLSLDKGFLQIQGDISLAGQGGMPTEISFANGEIAVESPVARIQGDTAPLVAAGRVAVGDIRADLQRRTLIVGRARLSGPAARLVRQQSGELLLPLPPRGNIQKTEQTADRAWSATVQSFLVVSGSVEFVDQALRQPAALSLRDIGLELGDISTIPGKPWRVDFSAAAAKNGRISIKGACDPHQAQAQFQAILDKVDLTLLSPYLAEASPITPAEGSVSANLLGSFALSGEAPELELQGGFSIDGLSLALGRREFAGFSRLQADGLRYATSPTAGAALAADAIVLRRPRMNLVLDRDGGLSVSKAVAAAPAKEKEAAEGRRDAPQPEKSRQSRERRLPGGLRSIKIGAVAVNGGKFTLTDRSFSPPHTLAVDGIDLSVKNIAAGPARNANVEARATINGASVTVAGTVNPLLEEPAAAMSLAVKNLGLQSLTPYAEKFIAYPVQRGDLDLEATVTLAGGRINSQNQILIRRLSLGDKVNAPGAPNLPVPLAIALLSDRNGDIQLNIPVDGDIRDPQFRIGGIVARVIANIMLKTITSPFSLLTGILGGAVNLVTGGAAPEMENVAFARGDDRIAPDAVAKLRGIAEALRKRPAINLELVGVADLAERRAIVSVRLQKKMQQLKFAKLPKEEQAKTTPDAMRVGANVDIEEYGTLLRAAYRSMVSFAAPSPDAMSAADMIRRIQSDAKTSGQDVLELANARAKAVQGVFMAVDGSFAQRIVIGACRVGETQDQADSEDQADSPDDNRTPAGKTSAHVEMKIK